MIFVLIFLFSCSSSGSISWFPDQYRPYVVLTYQDQVHSVIILLEESKIPFQIKQTIEPYTGNAFAGIWLGELFPIKTFKEILRYIRNYYPDLHYIDLIRKKEGIPENILYSLYIGGKTETALKKNLKAWSEEDFKKLLSLQTKKEIHNFILKKNGQIP